MTAFSPEPKASGKPAPSGVRLASRAFLALNEVRRRLSKKAPSIPILSYHRVSAFHPEHYMTLLPEHFEQILRATQKEYTFVSLAEIDELLQRGRLDAPVIGLSFDDSYGCNATYAAPILQALRIPATFFVSSGYVDSDAPMQEDVAQGHSNLPNFTSAQLRGMAETGLFEIGSHTVSHMDLSKDWTDAEIRRELADSKASLEKVTGRPVTRFAFPFGQWRHCRPQPIRVAREVGYERLYSFFGGRNRLTSSAPTGYVLQRICPIYEDIDFVRACLENYRGRRTRLPLVGRGPALTTDFHPTYF